MWVKGMDDMARTTAGGADVTRINVYGNYKKVSNRGLELD
jgi:hypothetical protein